jgi:pimeloyl-ACP methyl ester carboxylesterase
MTDKTEKRRKRKKTILITLCVIAIILGFLKIYFATGNIKYNNKINELIDNGKMNVQIESKIEHKTIEYNGNTIHYFVSGNEEGETIVFLHPAFSDHRCFDKQIDYFSQDYRVITIDMSGHGLTGVGKSKDKITSTSTHIAEILKTENRDNTHLIGVSLGSLLAQDFALKYPAKVLSLTALGGYNINKEQKEVARAQRSEMFKWLFKIVFSMDAFRRYTANTSVIDELEQIRFYESAKHFTRKSFTVMSRLDRMAVNRSVQRNYPVLILAGEKDSELALKMAKQWHEEEPVNSKLFVIENAGHCANMDNAEDFNRIVMDFMNSRTFVDQTS